MTDTVRQAELSQGEVYRVYRELCFAAICCDRVSDIERKRFVSSCRLSLSFQLCIDPRMRNSCCIYKSYETSDIHWKSDLEDLEE